MATDASAPVVLCGLLLTVLIVAWAMNRWSTVRYEERLADSLGRVDRRGGGHRLDRHLARLPVLSVVARRLDRLQLEVRLTQVLLGWAALAYPVLWLLSRMYGHRLGLILTVIAIPGLSIAALGLVLRRRRATYAQQTLDLVRHLAGSARAGLSIGHALTNAASELGDPIAPELHRVVLDMELGKLPVVALEEFQARSSLPETDLLVNAVVIQQRSGGDLVSLLTRLAAGMEAIGRGRTEAEGLVAGVRIMPWTVLFLALTGLYTINRLTDGILDRMHQWPLLEVALYVFLALLVAVVPVMQRLTRLER